MTLLHNNYHQELDPKSESFITMYGDHEVVECEAWGDNRCGRCGGVVSHLEEKAEVAEHEDVGDGESGPVIRSTTILVHVGCMHEGEEVA